jgi:calcineurin-like phosphoesterase family protein
MNFLFFSDTHFTDKKQDEYRWDVFKHLTENALKHNVECVVHLGDLVDTKDRHSAELVNKLVDSFADLQHDTNSRILILAGNHDQPIRGPYFWDFLNKVKNVSYIQEPLSMFPIYIALPFSSKPKEDWKGLPLQNYRAIFMHQTIQGALVENDRPITNNPVDLPDLPPGVEILSGDVHRPQKIGNVTYVGCSHPIRFSETWANRIILIKDDDFKNPIDIWLPSIKRAILDINSVDDLKDLQYKSGDQLKVRCKLSADKLTSWPVEEDRIKAWALERGIHLQSVEPALVGDTLKKDQEDGKAVELMTPKEVIKLFSEQEKLSPELVEMALDCLKESE